jgi:hypothetical protein
VSIFQYNHANSVARIDLTAANSVHIFEPHWNPMAEAQAVDRIHRIGQQHDVEVVRYIVDESIESVSFSSVTSASSKHECILTCVSLVCSVDPDG